MKKKLLLAAFVALIATGCSKNENGQNQSSDNFINFKPYVSNTKAVDATNTTIQSSGFNVYAWYNKGEASSAVSADFIPDFMSKQLVSWNSEWTYSPAKYWPATGSLDFIAVGNNVTAVTETPTAGEYKFVTDASPAIEFTTSAVSAEQKDLIVSADMLGKTSTDEAITFNLKHLLSKIDVQVKNTSDLTLEVTSVKFVGITPTATYDLVAGTWGAASGIPADNVLTIKSSLTFAKDAAVKIHEDNEALIIIPQTATSAKIEYQYEDADGNIIEDCTGANAVEVTLSDSWANNKYYTYTFAITPKAKNIKFSANVDNWTPAPIEK